MAVTREAIMYGARMPVFAENDAFDQMPTVASAYGGTVKLEIIFAAS